MQVDVTGDTKSAAASALNPVGGKELDKTAFLKLLVAQLRNQNPLEPMSNTEFVAQLAQFSSVEQLVSVNEGLNTLQMQQMGMSNAQAASFIGKDVEVRSDTLEVGSDDKELKVGFKIEGDAATVQVNIRDASGAVVRTIDLGGNPKGDVTFDWDLRNDQGVVVPPGSYRMDVVAKDDAGSPVNWEAHARGVVNGVSYENGYPELIVGGSIKAALGDVVGVYPAGETVLGAQTTP
ncbi:MAG: flagellar hook assembly protein FlgD [Deltaproteobacteria bacterium]|nr:flagellar hook assembly protein FlgD [Deltaproteobacteria bacterium]